MIRAAVSLIICTSILGVVVYFLFLRRGGGNNGRPLPPGPTPWPIVGNLPQLGPKPHQSMAALARVHGPLMHLKMGFVHVVVAASASVAEKFLKVHDTNFLSRPPNSGAEHIAYNYNDLVFAPHGPRWRLLRKICALHLFSSKALDDFRHVREEEVGILIRKLASVGEMPASIGQMMYVCATNAISRVMLGRHVLGDEHRGAAGSGGDTTAEEFKAMVVELMVLAGVFNVGDFIPPLKGLDLQGVVAKMKKLHQRFDAFFSGILHDHKINGSNAAEGHVDLLTTLISLKDVDNNGEGGKLTDTEIKALLLDLFTAGTDTTSSTVEWAITELIRNPNILARVRNELDLIVGKDKLVKESDLGQLTYLQAVIKENFRLHPSTPLSLPRVAQESCEINGYYIPKDSTLLVNVWAIGRDPNVWPDPLEFRPERFLMGGEKPNVDVRGNDFELIPFGSGRRVCAGMNLGIRMVQLLIATMVHAFDFELTNGQLAQDLNMEEAYGITLQRADPLVVHPRPRLARHVYQAQV
ncbi:Cytochrome P450 superfamily protein [Perilla frutescens var. hirtella]|uniref:Flavonoid-6-hydroxylase n=1 Tax=Perilla frutescens var. hirtella TaxID=608512 RepID=A0AAD4J0H2_PERFH|nr:Cytochrome P450 superfamily protein [Perilla frutescens var. hirtella]